MSITSPTTAAGGTRWARGPGRAAAPSTPSSAALAAHGTNVYVGTDAINIAGIAQADHVAKWNGSAWSAMGSNTAGGDGWFPASTFIYALTTSGSLVFAAGSFQNANGDPLADDIAYFDGSAWHPLGSNGAGNGPLNGNVAALATFGQALYAGGTFNKAGGNTLASSVASYAFAGLSSPGGGGGSRRRVEAVPRPRPAPRRAR